MSWSGSGSGLHRNVIPAVAHKCNLGFHQSCTRSTRTDDDCSRHGCSGRRCTGRAAVVAEMAAAVADTLAELNAAVAGTLAEDVGVGFEFALDVDVGTDEDIALL